MTFKNVLKGLICLNIVYWIVGMLFGFFLHIHVTSSSSIISVTPTADTVIKIFLNNIKVAAEIIILGLLSLGFIPCLQLLINAMIYSVTLFSDNTKIMYNLSMTLPHGILEIPSIIVSGAIGSLSLYFLLNAFFARKSYKVYDVKIMIKKTIYLIIINIGMYFIAAIIEGIITPKIGELFL